MTQPSDIPNLVAGRYGLGIVVRPPSHPTIYDEERSLGDVISVEINTLIGPTVLDGIPLGIVYPMAHGTSHTNVPSLLSHIRHAMTETDTLTIPATNALLSVFNGSPSLTEAELVPLLSKAYGDAIRRRQTCLCFTGPGCAQSHHLVPPLHAAINAFTRTGSPARAAVSHACLSCFLRTMEDEVLGVQRFTYHITTGGDVTFAVRTILLDDTSLSMPVYRDSALTSLPHAVVAVLAMPAASLFSYIPPRVRPLVEQAVALLCRREAQLDPRVLDTPLLAPIALSAATKTTLAATSSDVIESISLSLGPRSRSCITVLAAVSLTMGLSGRIASTSHHIPPPSFKACVRAIAALVGISYNTLHHVLTSSDGSSSPGEGSENVGPVAAIPRAEVVSRLGQLVVLLYRALLAWICDEINVPNAPVTPIVGSIHLLETPPVVPVATTRGAVLCNLAHELALGYLRPGSAVSAGFIETVTSDRAITDVADGQVTLAHSHGRSAVYPSNVTELVRTPEVSYLQDSIISMIESTESVAGTGLAMIRDTLSEEPILCLRSLMESSFASEKAGIYLVPAATTILHDAISSDPLRSVLNLDAPLRAVESGLESSPSLLDRFKVPSPYSPTGRERSSSYASLKDLADQLIHRFGAEYPRSSRASSPRSPRHPESPRFSERSESSFSLRRSSDPPFPQLRELPLSSPRPIRSPRPAKGPEPDSRPVPRPLSGDGFNTSPYIRKDSVASVHSPLAMGRNRSGSVASSTAGSDVVDKATDRLYKDAAARRGHLETLRTKFIDQELNKTKGSPKSTKGRSRPASASPSITKSFEERQKGFLTAREHKIAALKQQHESEVLSQATFKPKIDTNSSKMVKQDPERLFAWSTLREKKLEKLRQEAVDAELSSVTGGPAIPEKSKKLAASRAAKLGLSGLQPTDRLMKEGQAREERVTARREQDRWHRRVASETTRPASALVPDAGRVSRGPIWSPSKESSPTSSQARGSPTGRGPEQPFVLTEDVPIWDRGLALPNASKRAFRKIMSDLRDIGI
ncbi:hypothetical protein J8273_7142 [Carpediemonas membranifera]|uniref:Uncharacterized protein n=1 Tax=Carpediemonas membranifera TaxID=201153 RepID=A0A8J6E1P0_9EUKA|nr:hypothetical protein J8273_7142 [Carpediemonas membranifera]|eukprot:KAG9390877.1 hypothetical protein J8273_7142 [Carpediemonas membranifera]